MGKLKKKGTVGAKRTFITRRKALQRLQVSLKDFRRLCILKGIYPVEPKNRAKLAAGSSVNKTYYLLSDIQFLKHEPVIWKLWDFKVFMRKLSRARGRADFETLQRLKENKPLVKLDHIVKERYPTFIDALRDIDDALCMCALYSQFPKSGGLPMELVELSRRLITEFMLYVIETRSLRKVFVSIKGYYFQAEIKGQVITWLTPHQFVLSKYHDADFRVIRTFTEFYVTFLGFVLYKLYTSSNLIYPPKTSADETEKTINDEDDNDDNNEDNYTILSEQTSALNRPLVRSALQFEDEVKVDYFENEHGTLHADFHALIKHQKLFEGLKFFLNREVPREMLVFVVRSFGGQVSWDGSVFPGATFDEKDETITHHVVDREQVRNKVLNRYYIQPQWIFDSVNAKRLLPVELYFYDVTLPPHLSPFVEEKEGDYVPPEKLALMGEFNAEQAVNDEKEDEDEEVEDDDDEKEEEEDEGVVEEEEEEEEEEKPQKKSKKEKKRSEKNREIGVKPGRQFAIDKQEKEKRMKAEEKRLAVMMIPKKKKRLYDLIIKSKKHQAKEKAKLTEKRKLHDTKNVKQKKKVKFNV